MQFQANTRGHRPWVTSSIFFRFDDFLGAIFFNKCLQYVYIYHILSWSLVILSFFFKYLTFWMFRRRAVQCTVTCTLHVKLDVTAKVHLFWNMIPGYGYKVTVGGGAIWKVGKFGKGQGARHIILCKKYSNLYGA